MDNTHCKASWLESDKRWFYALKICRIYNFVKYSCIMFELVMKGRDFTDSAAYMYQWIGSALVQIMACRLLSVKPLAKPMLSYCQLEP